MEKLDQGHLGFFMSNLNTLQNMKMWIMYSDITSRYESSAFPVLDIKQSIFKSRTFY